MLMIRQYQKGERLTTVSKTPQRIQNKITFKMDAELANQIDFLSKHLEIKKLEVLRQLVKKKIISLGLLTEYQEFPKLYNEEELLSK